MSEFTPKAAAERLRSFCREAGSHWPQTSQKTHFKGAGSLPEQPGRSPEQPFAVGGPVLAVVLGSGLGGLANAISAEVCVPFSEIPGLARPSASGHRGEFLLGWLGSSTSTQIPVIAMAGRLHAYEGHSLEDLVRPMAVMIAMGATACVVSCAAGGLHPDYQVGDLTVITDHMSWLHGRMGAVPMPALTVPLSLPVPAMPATLTCDHRLAQVAESSARKQEIALRRGTYLAVNGPNYETRAECRMMRRLGVDLVGMSTVPELILASRSGLRTLGVGVVTNLAVPDRPQAAHHEEVLQVCDRAGEHLQKIVVAICDHLATDAD